MLLITNYRRCVTYNHVLNPSPPQVDIITAPNRYCAMQNRTHDPTCRVPLPSQRTRPAVGKFFSDAETNGLNLFYAQCVVNAIDALAATAKAVSGGKIFTVSFYGYLFALADSRLAGSGHLGLTQILQSPHVDAVASPYQ